MEQEVLDKTNKWVCVTKYWENFTYGKVYEGNISGSLLDVKNDVGERTSPCLSGIKTHTNIYGVGLYDKMVKEKVNYFIPLEEWREEQLNKIL